jgi:plasmid stabilization system protein ParE
MIYNIELLLRARVELLEAWEWYEDKQVGLGDRFKEQVFKSIVTIEKYPERYPERTKNYREASVKIFPYFLIYRIRKRKKLIAVVSVFHTRRNPRKKYRK